MTAHGNFIYRISNSHKIRQSNQNSPNNHKQKYIRYKIWKDKQGNADRQGNGCLLSLSIDKES